jgi:NAD(P)-dependent dehydrogenase (short-subunit alcohol dehydrogenase family)
MTPQDARYPSLDGRVVFVTGGGSGIGESIVEHFCAQGSRVTFVDVQEDARTVAEDGPVKALVNNAANDDRHKVEAVTEAYWEDRFQVNLRHQFFAAQAVRPSMRDSGGGSIVNMGSISWMAGEADCIAYVTAKSAVNGLTRGLARELGPENIRVNCVVPGWVMTRRQLDLWVTPEGEKQMDMMQCLPGRLYPPDIARMVLWLAADDSRMCASQNFIVDAGWV